MIRAMAGYVLVLIADPLIRVGLALMRAANRIDGPPPKDLFAEWYVTNYAAPRGAHRFDRTDAE